MAGFGKSPWILHYDASSCNGCDIETLACLTPLFDVERLGVVNTGNPKHADIFLVTGAVNEQSKSVIRNLYEQMPEPKTVVAVGACACTGGIFRECYNISGGVDSVIPVDVYVPGCAARPEAIIDGVVKAIQVLGHKHRAMRSNANRDQTLYSPADPQDAPEILALQRIAYRLHQELYGGEENVPPLTQTLQELTDEFGRTRFVKAVVNGKLIGSARVRPNEHAAEVSRIMVHPYFQGRGIGRRLLSEVERACQNDVKVFETAVGGKSEENIAWLQRQGYQIVQIEPSAPADTRVHLRKERQ
jgi:ech hydrogenase subunit C